jgi:hypothetical protein
LQRLRRISAAGFGLLAMEISPQGEGAQVVGIFLKQTIGGIDNVLSVPQPLLGCQQQFQRTQRDHAVRVLLEESLQRLSLGIGVDC